MFNWILFRLQNNYLLEEEWEIEEASWSARKRKINWIHQKQITLSHSLPQCCYMFSFPTNLQQSRLHETKPNQTKQHSRALERGYIKTLSNKIWFLSYWFCCRLYLYRSFKNEWILHSLLSPTEEGNNEIEFHGCTTNMNWRETLTTRGERRGTTTTTYYICHLQSLLSSSHLS